MGLDRCRWIAQRLPLFAGGELLGSERRRVERHLLTCAHCRVRFASHSGALERLRSAGLATELPAHHASLWPPLQRQIRESRHEPAFVFPARRLHHAWRLGLAAGLMGVVASLSFGIWNLAQTHDLSVRPPIVIRPAKARRASPAAMTRRHASSIAEDSQLAQETSAVYATNTLAADPDADDELDLAGEQPPSDESTN